MAHGPDLPACCFRASSAIGIVAPFDYLLSTAVFTLWQLSWVMVTGMLWSLQPKIFISSPLKKFADSWPKPSTLVCYGCPNKVPQIGWLKITGIYCFTAGGLMSRITVSAGLVSSEGCEGSLFMPLLASGSLRHPWLADGILLCLHITPPPHACLSLCPNFLFWTVIFDLDPS